MAYYLMVKNSDDYKSLDISSLGEFQRLSKFKGSSYSLNEIDLFTSKFIDEIALKSKLFEQGIITIEDITKSISIRRKDKGEYEKIKYGLVYQYISRFLDVFYLKNTLHLLQHDVEFLKKLLNQYSHEYDVRYEIPAIREIKNSIEKRYTNIDLDQYQVFNNFFNNLIYDRQGKVKYKALHDLAMFIYDYRLKQGRSQIDIELSKKSHKKELEELQKSLTPSEKKPYIRTKKKYNLDGQTSFF